MSEQSARGQFGIGEVLAQLQPEFPDISTSKIRFLEAEGLIEPARSRSGYRRFSAADIERLRFILTMQRDSYLPLRVIRERLAMKGDGEVGGGPDGYIDDQLSDVRPWGFEPGQVTVPVLVFHGGQDQMVPSAHGAWLAARCPDAELWLRPDDGHVSVLGSCGVAALDWLVAHA